MTLTRPNLLALVAGHGFDGIETTGDQGAWQRLGALLDAPDPSFAIVTP